MRGRDGHEGVKGRKGRGAATRPRSDVVDSSWRRELQLSYQPPAYPAYPAVPAPSSPSRPSRPSRPSSPSRPSWPSYAGSRSSFAIVMANARRPASGSYTITGINRPRIRFGFARA